LKRRVCIVDDSLTVRMDLGEALREAGFEVALCPDLECARARLSGGDMDLLVLDVRLPDGDGIGFLRELKSAPATARLPVILLSTQAEVGDRLHGLEIGAEEYLGKPYDRQMVVRRARELTADGTQRRMSILVIEDSATYRESLRVRLEDAGFSVITAESGEQGLHVAAAERPAALLVDYMLPGMSGAGVIRRVRQDVALRRTPALLLTASEDPADELRALEAGADSFVRKDQDFDVVLACLNAIVRSASTPAAVETSIAGPKRIALVGCGSEYLAELRRQFEDEPVEIERHAPEELTAPLPPNAVDAVVVDAGGHLEGAQQFVRDAKAASLPDARFVVIGPSDARAAFVETMNAGADDYVPSSAGAALLAARVRAHLRRKELEDENRAIREQILRNQLAAQAQKEVARATAAANEELRRLAEVAERKAREAEESRREFQQLSEAVPAMVWVSDARGATEHLNQRWYEYTGLSAERSLRDRWAEAVHKEDRLPVTNAWRIAVACGKEFQFEYRLRRHDGEYRWFLGRAVPLRSETGISRWFGTATDIHERKLAEEALRRSEKLAATGRLAAAIAHEINNPLAAVVNALYLLHTAVKDNPEAALHYVRTAQAEIERVSHITRQTLAFYRETDEPEAVDVCALISELMEVYGGKARAAGITIETDLQCEPDTAFGFAGEIRQVLSNLIANAIEASERGGRVRVRVRGARDWQSGRSGVRVLVSDRGKGVSPAVARDIFKPFVTTKGQKGTGLGLWVSQSIVQRHNGSLRYRSSNAPGRSGACFSVFIPAAAHEGEPSPMFGGAARDARRAGHRGDDSQT
jgi:PAS domain S-box-containing protein